LTGAIDELLAHRPCEGRWPEPGIASGSRCCRARQWAMDEARSDEISDPAGAGDDSEAVSEIAGVSPYATGGGGDIRAEGGRSVPCPSARRRWCCRIRWQSTCREPGVQQGLDPYSRTLNHPAPHKSAKAPQLCWSARRKNT